MTAREIMLSTLNGNATDRVTDTICYERQKFFPVLYNGNIGEIIEYDM